MTLIKEGDIFPELNKIINSTDLKGKKLILYFYPKDNTPGCTNEAINFRDNFSKLQQDNYVVIGVSPDSDESHIKFSTKLNLPFKLISDSDKKIMNSCGVWGEKKLYGKTFMGVKRTTFVTDENGIVLKVFNNVKTKEHFEQIINAFNKNK